MLKTCCRAEAGKSLTRHRDVAICDECGNLLLAYGNGQDFQSTVEELTRHGVRFETETLEKLRVVAKPSTRSRS